jgi:hypothetical protein
MELSISKPIANLSPDALAQVLTDDAFYDALSSSGLFESVIRNGEMIEFVAPTNLPKIITALFPKAPKSVGWSEALTVSEDGVEIITVPNVPDSWREYFSITRTVTCYSARVTEQITLDIELPKKWKRLVSIFESRLTELLEERLRTIERLAQTAAA